MAHAEHAVVIQRRVPEVFAYVADGLNNQQWRPDVVEIDLKSGTPGAVGAEYRQVLHGPGGRPIDGDYRLTEVVPDKVLAFVVTAGPARPEGRYTFTPEAEGTAVQFALDYHPRGLGWLMAPLVARAMRGEVASLDRLKQVLEQQVI